MTSLPSQALVGFSDIRTQAIDDWQQFKAEGLQYLGLAERAFHKGNTTFTPDILYNLITMAIEKMVMSALMAIGRLPFNHTMHDLVAALEQWLPEAVRGMEEPIRSLDSYQDICDPYACSIRIPTGEEIAGMLVLARQLEQRLSRPLPEVV